MQIMNAEIDTIIRKRLSKKFVLNCKPLKPIIDFMIDKALYKLSHLKKIRVRLT